MTEYLTKNSKIAKSNDDNSIVYNFGLPARDDICYLCNLGNSCYAKNGPYRWSNVAKAFEWRYQETLKTEFVDNMIKAIEPKAKTADRKGKQLYIRVHDSGDYYSPSYVMKWVYIARAFPNVVFYSYTKQVALFKALQDSQVIPANMVLIYSFGGKQDNQINPLFDRHAKIFANQEVLENAGYTSAMENDLIALGDNPKVGLVYHGPKKYKIN